MMPVTEENIARHKKNSQWGIHGVYISGGNNKMGRIPSFSTLPICTCAKGIPCVKDCYASKLARLYKAVRATWEANTAAVKAGLYDEIIADISAYLDGRPSIHAFRWNISGDIYDLGFLDMMVTLARRYPHITFMAFTKKYDLVPLDRSNVPDNLKFVLSAWKQYRPSKILTDAYPVAYFDDGSDECQIPVGAFHCGGNCEKCLKCFKMGAGSSVYFTKH